MATNYQNASFNRSGRISIPSTGISLSFDKESRQLSIQGLTGDWMTRLPVGSLNVRLECYSAMYSDIRQIAVDDLSRESTWPIVFDCPLGIVDVGWPIKFVLNVTDEAARLVATTDPIVAHSGSVGGWGGSGVGLLAATTDSSLVGEMWRLTFEQEGPVVAISAQVERLEDLKAHPIFVYGALPGILVQVYRQIALQRGSLPVWAQAWLRLPGASGSSEKLDAIEFSQALPELMKEVDQWAVDVVEAVSDRGNFVERFNRSHQE